MESLNLINSKKIIENEVEILQSRVIINEVINKLHLYAPIYYKDGLNNKSAYGNSPVIIELRHPELLSETTYKISFEFKKNSQFVYLENNLLCPINTWVYTKYGIIKFSKNNNYHSTKNESFLFKLLDNESVVNTMYNNLKVTATNKLSSIIDLKYRDNSPKLAENVLNEIINSYNSKINSEKNQLALNTLKFIDARLKVVSSDIDLIERRMESFKGSREAVDISTQGQIFLQNVSINDQKLSDVDMKISVLNDLERNIRNANTNVSSFLPSTLGVVDPSLSQLLNSLNSSELEYQKLKNTVAEQNPILISIIDQIATTKDRIKANIDNYRKSLESNRNNLLATNNNYNQLLQNIPAKELALLEISRDKKIKSDIYAFLLQKREESEIAYASTLSDNTIVTHAHASTNPVSPNNYVILGSLMFAIIGFPIGLVGLRDAFSNSIRFRQDIESVTDLPIIGEISHNGLGRQKLLASSNENFQYEDFRRLRYALGNRGLGVEHKKLLITSSISGEGKSYIATNLAISFADVGKRVVLLDFDFKKSSLSSFFEMQEEMGVTDYLSGLVSETDILHHLPVYGNLSFISSGTIHNHTTSLLENGTINDLLEHLEANFDIVIIDSSPMLQVADAYLLSAYCDTTLYVVKHGYSSKNIIENFNYNQETSLFKDVVILYNGVRDNGLYRFGYGYNMNANYSGSTSVRGMGNTRFLN